MLIISRRKGQRIVIGHDTEIVVTDLSRSTVKLGIRAPTKLQVLRGEVWDSIERANREAASSALDEDALGAALGSGGVGVQPVGGDDPLLGGKRGRQDGGGNPERKCANG